MLDCAATAQSSVVDCLWSVARQALLPGLIIVMIREIIKIRPYATGSIKTDVNWPEHRVFPEKQKGD
jgi:hypothetical protein